MPYPGTLVHSRDESETQKDMQAVSPTDAEGLLLTDPKLTPVMVNVAPPEEGALGATSPV